MLKSITKMLAEVLGANMLMSIYSLLRNTLKYERLLDGQMKGWVDML